MRRRRTHLDVLEQMGSTELVDTMIKDGHDAFNGYQWQYRRERG